MAFKYFLGLNPEDAVPDASLLSKFRKTRLSEDMLEGLISETMKQAIEKGLVKSNAVIVDSTHTRSKHLPERPTQILRGMTKDLRREIYRTQSELSERFPEKPLPEDTIEDELLYTQDLINAVEKDIIKFGSPKAKKLLEKVKETLQTPNIRDIQCLYDCEAKIGHKAVNNKFFGYKTHVAVTESEGLISAITVTDGNASDSVIMPQLLDKSLENGVEITEAIGDMAYSGVKNLEYADDLGITVIAKVNPGVDDYNAEKRGEYVFFNKDANTYECRCGYLANPTSGGIDSYGQSRIKYAWKKKQCQNCPYKRKCLGSQPTQKQGHDYKKFFWSITKDSYRTKQKEFQETDYFKQRYKARYKVESKNAELKNIHA